jgi:hypothetical protein
MTAPNSETGSMEQQIGNGNPDGIVIGQVAADLVGFYGTTPAAQVAATALTALATTTLTEAKTGIWGFSSSTVAQTWRARINQLVVDIGVLKTMGLFG